MPEPDGDANDPTDEDLKMDTSSASDQEWNDSLGISTPSTDPVPSSLEIMEETEITPTAAEPTVESVEPPPSTTSIVKSSPTTLITDNSSLVLATSQNSDSDQTYDTLDEVQLLQTDIAVCNQMLEEPSTHLMGNITIENNINILFSQFASGALPCPIKSHVRFLAQDLIKKGILNKSNQLLFQNWPKLQGSAPLDVLLLLYSRLIEKSSSEISNQKDILQQQLQSLKKVSFDLELEKTKNQALCDEKESMKHEIKQKQLETATNQTIEDKYILQLTDLKNTMIHLRKNGEDLKNKLQAQTELASTLRIKQASMIPLEESSAAKAELQKSLDQVKAEKETVDAKHEQLATDLSKNSAQLTILEREAASNKITNATLQEQLEAAQKENAKKQVTITDLKVDKNKTTEDLQSLTSDHDKLMGDLSTKEKKIASLQRKLADKEKLWSKEKPAQQQIAEAHKKEVESLLSKIDALQKDKQKASAALTSRNADLEKLKKNLQKMEKQFNDLKKANETLPSTSIDDPSKAHMEEKLSMAEYATEELQKAKDHLQDENNKKEAQIRSLRDRILSLELRIEGSATEEAVVEMQEGIARLEKDLEEAAARSNELGEAKQSLETDLDEAAETIQDLKDRLEAKEKRITKILQERRLNKVATTEYKVGPVQPVADLRTCLSTPNLASAPSTHNASEDSKGENENTSSCRSFTPSPSSDGSLPARASSSATSSPPPRSPTPPRTIVENPDDFPCEPIDPSAEFPLDIPHEDQPTPAVKRKRDSPTMATKLSRFSQSPKTVDNQPLQHDHQPPMRPPLLKADQFDHYDRMTKTQHSNVLQILRSSKGKITARLQSDHQFIDHLRGNGSESSKEKAVSAVLKSISQCTTIKQLNTWTPLHQSQNDFLPFPDLSNGSPEWDFIAHRRPGAGFIHHGATMALFRAYCSKAYRFFEFVKTSPEISPEAARLTFLHLHPMKKDKSGAPRSVYEKKLDLILVLIIVRLALYETDHVLVFPTNKKRLEHYVNIPFSPAWIEEMMDTRFPSDPYLLPKQQFFHLYVDCQKCSNAINAWEGRDSSNTYTGSQGSIMDRL